MPRLAAALSLFAAMATAAPLTAQTTAPPGKCKAGSKEAACKSAAQAPAAAPSAASENPFPVEDSLHGSGATGNSNGSGGSGGSANGFPEMPTTGVPDPPASSEKPLKLPPDGYTGSSGSNDTAGSSSSRTPDDDSDVAPTTAAPDAPVKASALKDFGSHGDTSAARLKLEQTRVADDLKVGSFYMKDGNTQGAYLRFKDAVEHAPEDPDARYSLAEAANRLNKRDEAVLNYQECLRLDPAGDHDKASRKALQKLGAK